MLPRHLAIIMDGNGRWAEKRLLPRSAGHRAGFRRMLALAEHAFSCGIEYLTLYALSAENFRRPKEELDALFDLLRAYFSEQLARLKENGVRLRVIGDRTLLPEDIVRMIKQGESLTAGGTRATLVLAVAYGARQEIVSAVNRAVEQGGRQSMESFSALLDTAGIPDPDLIIRTGKEKRLSNFLLWQAAYCELYFSDKMFPAFTNRDLDRALEDFSGRKRRYGGLSGGSR